MESYGYIYVPPNCAAGLECKFHVFFHGCSMQLEEIGTDFITESGFIQVADENDIIILFPSVSKANLILMISHLRM